MEPPSSGHRITLYRADGVALAPSTPDAPPDPPAERLAAARWAAAPDGAAVVAPGAAADGVVLAWRVLPDWGVVVTDALDRGPALHAWRRTVLVYFLVATLGSAALVGFALAVLRAIRRTEIATRQTEAEMRQRLQAEAKLRQAQKMDALGQFTGGVAHDFNNLLMALQGNLDMLRKRLPPEDAKALRLLENAERGARRGAALTQRMLAFARRQEPAAPGDERGGAGGRHGRPAAKFARPAGADRDRISRRTCPGLGRSQPTRTRHRQSGHQCARRHAGRRTAHAGGPHAVGRPREVPELAAGEYLCLTVSDTGEGMDPNTLVRAIEPFFTTKGSSKGTGLGLSMVHGFACQSGGALVLRSQPGQGTTAELWLPRAPVAAAADPPTPCPLRTTAPPATCCWWTTMRWCGR